MFSTKYPYKTRKRSALFAFVRYPDSALDRESLNVRKISSHISGAAFVSRISTGSAICFLKLRYP